MSWVTVWESEAASEPMKKMARPTNKTIFRDQISESLP
jgi:hypothetical protein